MTREEKMRRRTMCENREAGRGNGNRNNGDAKESCGERGSSNVARVVRARHLHREVRNWCRVARWGLCAPRPLRHRFRVAVHSCAGGFAQRREVRQRSSCRRVSGNKVGRLRDIEDSGGHTHMLDITCGCNGKLYTHVPLAQSSVAFPLGLLHRRLRSAVNDVCVCVPACIV